MIVQVHGFDWAVYAERVMPAFARWLIDKDETAIYQLFERTRCALEEQFLPEPMQRLRVWPRAMAFVDTLPRGPHSRREYIKLCSAEQFTILGDRYLHHHAPHLYRHSPALRTVWGAIIEEYCLPWFYSLDKEIGTEQVTGAIGESEEDAQTARSELVSLLHAAGLPELAREIGEQAEEVERFEWEPGDDIEPVEAAQATQTSVNVEAEEAGEVEGYDLYAGEEDAGATRPKGILLGPHSNMLQLRGWLAGISVRAMALFEYLACGRRHMPFGYEPGEPFGAYCGYLTPGESGQLAMILHDVKPPSQSEVEKDYKSFQEQQITGTDTFRLIDEVLPTNAYELLSAVRKASLQGLGLICSVD